MTGMAIAMAGAVLGQEGEPVWHVSAAGNDAWSGRLPAPNAAGTDGPVASLVVARDRSREQSGVPRRIVLASGDTYVDATVVFDPRDSRLTVEGAGMGQTRLYGGRRIEGWRREGDRFLAADIGPGADPWSFRVLVVGDEIRPRARFPETGRLEHETVFPVRWMSTAGGGWERKPTDAELTTMRLKVGDLAAGARLDNAEITVYHMWDESTVGVKGYDQDSRLLTLASPCGHPPGAFGVQTYVIWNTAEGMTRPGQWYLDHAAGKVIYWPLADETPETLKVVAPTVEVLLSVKGTKDSPVEDLRVSNLTLSTTDAPLKAAGFGASAWPGAIESTYGSGLVLDRVEVTHAGGYAIRDWASAGLLVRDCWLHHVGGGGIRLQQGRVEGCRIHDIGLLCASSIGLMGGGKESVIRRNIIHDVPYSGMCVGGTGTLIEENLLYRCMQQLHDGAAIYMSGGTGNIIRRNVVRDIEEVGSGYGVSAYYLDEKCRRCVVEGNVSIGVERPTHNHMTLECVLRNNVFLSSGDMNLSFPRSSGFEVEGNTFEVGGRLTISEPDAVRVWEGNIIVSQSGAESSVSDAMPRAPFTPRDKPVYGRATRLDKAPEIDGVMQGDEWPTGGMGLRESPAQRPAPGAPISAKLAFDDDTLYLAVVVVSMFPETRKLGHQWGADEGVEVALSALRPDGTRVTHVLRGYADGFVEALSLGGASSSEAAALHDGIRYAAGVDAHTWRCEWAVPFAALGETSGEVTVLPLNLTVYRSEDAQIVQWAGTRGETWDLTLGGRAMLSPRAAAPAAPKPHPQVNADVVATAALIDGRIDATEWPGVPLSLAQTPGGLPLSGKPGQAWLLRVDTKLFVRFKTPVADAATITRGAEWRLDDGVEICFRGTTTAGDGVTWVAHGFAGGSYELSPEAGAPEAELGAKKAALAYAATLTPEGWECEWSVDLPAFGVTLPNAGVAFNLGAYRNQDHQWINWVGTGGPTWQVDMAGTLGLP